MEEINSNKSEIKNDLTSDKQPLLDIEKNSYSKYMYKKLVKARKKGLQYGVTIPPLKYELEKPEKTRKVFLIAGYTLLGFTIALFIGFIIMYIISGVFPMFIDMIRGTSNVYSKELFEKSLGLTSFGAISLTWLYIVIVILLLLPIGIIIGLVKGVIKNFALSKISKQEMAKGFEVSRYINILVISIFLTLLIGILFIVEGLTRGGLGVFITIMSFVIFACCLTLLIFIIKERKREKEWFNSLSEEKQQDFLNQNNAVKKYKNLSRIKVSNSNFMGRF